MEEKLKIIRDIRLQRMANAELLKNELFSLIQCKDEQKDIIIIVKDQLKYVQNCVESIQKNTKNFNLYIWDNGSKQETKEYLETLDAILVRSETNLGFIKPNNELIKLTKSPYIILLNSDTEVKENWDKAMLGWLQTHPETLEVGYAGSVLDKDFKGGMAHFGYDIDYVPGWALCISRDTYEKFGLFDEKNLILAYCEDADFSLRIKESGFQVYALCVDFVAHYENKTTLEVCSDSIARTMFANAFDRNHDYLKRRWMDSGILINACSVHA